MRRAPAADLRPATCERYPLGQGVDGQQCAGFAFASEGADPGFADWQGFGRVLAAVLHVSY